MTPQREPPVIPTIERHDWYRSFAVRGSVLRPIAPRLCVFLAIFVAETYARKLGLVPLELPWAAAAMVGSAVGLLIAFRTNSGFERFWEARTAWGALVNRTRNLARQLVPLVEGEGRRDAILLTIAFAHGAKRHLWHEDAVPEADALLGPERSQRLQMPPGLPQRALYEVGIVVAQLRRDGRCDAFEQHRLEENITALVDQFGICQRIRTTTLPDAYVIQLRSALTLFLAGLPLAMGDLGWYAPAIALAIAYVFVGMEQIGTELENPFERTPNDVKLDAICETIEKDLLALCDDDGPERPHGLSYSWRRGGAGPDEHVSRRADD
jgi:putative membrane protein